MDTKIIKCICGIKLRLDTTPNIQQRCSNCGFIHEYIDFEDSCIEKFENKGRFIGLHNKQVRHGKRKG